MTSNAVRYTRRSANLGFYSYALLLVAILSLSLSGCSGFVTASNNGGGSNVALSVSNVRAAVPTVSGFQVDWSTNLAANSAVDYGTSAAYGSSTPVDNSMVTSHQVNVTGLTKGTLYHFRVRSTDASSASANSGDMTFSTAADTTPPAVSITAPAANATLTGAVTVSASASDDVAVAGVQFKVDSANTGAAITSAPYGFLLDTTTLSNGNHILAAVATDTSGNSATSTGIAVKVSNTANAPPSINSVNPASGVVGTSVTIAGANFGATQGTSTVKFNGVAATPTSWSTTSIIAPVPAGATTGNVVVTVGGVASNGVSFTVQADTTPPTVPTGLTATAISSSQINLSWTASTDNVGVTGYNIFRGGTKIATAPGTSYQDAGLTASTSYTYNVSAFDAAGNTSGQSAGASATTPGSSGGGIPSSLGWFQIPNTAWAPLCPNATGQRPDVQGNSGCGYVADAWSGGAADTVNNRLLFTGGGHHDYYGNEIYSLNLNTLTISRLDVASNVSGINTNTTDYDACPDGTACPRHTYGGIAYDPTNGKLMFQGGGLTGPGDLGNTTWAVTISCLNPNSTGVGCWSQLSPTVTGGSLSHNFGNVMSYDPNSDSVWVWESTQSQTGNLWQYNRSTNTYTNRATYGSTSVAFLSGYQSGAIDSTRSLFFGVGNGKLLEVSIASGSNYVVNDMAGSASGCSTAIAGAYPGVAFDSVSKNLVIWQGGNSVYAYNPSTNACSTVTYTGGPTTVGQNGTFGRFQYFPALGVFAVCNEFTESCFTLRLESAGGSSGPVISSVGTTGVTASAATVTWRTDVTSTSQVDYGTSASYGTTTTLDSTLVTSHSVTLSGLLSGTTYHYRVRSKNSGGTESVSGDFAFATSSGGDTTPPTVSMTAPTNGATETGTVTVSANAADNVGVASVQFIIDGANLGSPITTSPYTMSWDTTTASNGAHSITAVARDAAGNTATAAAVSVTVSNTTPGAANTWPNRIAGLNVPGGASSIVSSLNFDTFPVTNKQQYFQIYDAAGITTDCTIAADGCSLKFTMLPGYFQGEPGWFDYNFNSSLTALYGQGQEFYVQFRERVSSSLLSGATFTNFEGWKLNILSEGDSPSAQAGNCSDTPTDFVLESDGTTFPWIYENCGGTASTLNFLNAAYAPIQLYTPNAPGGGNYLDQPAAGCPHYSGRGTPSTDPTCWNFVADEWFTVQEHLKIGTWNQANSVVDVWMAHQGQPSVLITNAADIAMADQGPSVTDKFGKIVLLPYATNATWNVLSNVWYDDLIVSNRRIPDPEVAIPNAPDSLSLSGITSSSVTVNWRVNSNNGTAQDDTGFLVERCLGNAPTCLPNPQSGFSQIGSTAAHASSYVDNTVSAGNAYTYRVRAKNAAGNSAYATAICFNGGTTCGGTAGL